jgi:hypothetical protein
MERESEVIKCNGCGDVMNIFSEYANGDRYYKCDTCGRTVYKTPAATFERKDCPTEVNGVLHIPAVEWKPLPFNKNAPYIMSKEDFNRMFLDRLAKCKDLVLLKEAEYSQGEVDRMIQFVEDARMNGTTVPQAAWNMFSKHVTSLRLAIKNEESITEKWLDDKITDMVIYPIIIEAILRRTQLQE